MKNPFSKWETEILRCPTTSCKKGQQQNQDENQEQPTVVVYTWLPKALQWHDRNDVGPSLQPVSHLALIACTADGSLKLHVTLPAHLFFKVKPVRPV